MAGQTRTGTAPAVADLGIETRQLDDSLVVLARGDLFPDALTAGPFAETLIHPILLTQSPDALSEPTAAWLERKCDAITAVPAVGREDAITPATHQAAVQAAEDCGDAPKTGEGSGEPVTVTGIEIAHADPTFTRLEFALAGDGQPGWTARYVDQAIQQGSGHTVGVAGDATIELMLDNLAYPPRDDRLLNGTRVPVGGLVEETYVSNVWEAESQIFIGDDHRAPFDVYMQPDVGLVVDVHTPSDSG